MTDMAVMPVSLALLNEMYGRRPSTGPVPAMCISPSLMSLISLEDIIHACVAQPSLTNASLAPYIEFPDDDIAFSSFTPLSDGILIVPQICCREEGSE